MNRRGSGLVVGGIILVTLMIIGGLVGGFFYAKQRGLFDRSTPEEPTPHINFLLRATDATTGDIVAASYIIEINKTVFKQGTLVSGAEANWTTLMLPLTANPTVYCWNDDHYLVKVPYAITTADVARNQSSLSCDMPRIGNLTVNHRGTLTNNLNSITLNLSTDAWFYRTGVCFAWSAGITSVSLPDQLLRCPSQWRNFSFYNETSQKFTWLSNRTWQCGAQQLEQCESVQNNATHCKLLTEEIPSRFRGKVDSCTYTGRTFNNQDSELQFLVKAENQNSLDYLEIIVYDRDRRYDPATDELEWISELNGHDIAASDARHVIYFNSELSGSGPG